MLHDFSSPSHFSRPVHVSLLLLVCVSLSENPIRDAATILPQALST
ncbi:unnamed protein product [Brassica oleracea]